MATVNITSFSPNVYGGTVVISGVSNLTSQTITTSGTSQQSNLFNASMIRVATTGNDVFVAIGNNPTASPTTGVLLLSGSVEYFAVPVGSRLAVINV